MHSKDLIRELNELGLEIKNHMEVVDEEHEKLLLDLYGPQKEDKDKEPLKQDIPEKDEGIDISVTEKKSKELKTKEELKVKEEPKEKKRLKKI